MAGTASIRTVAGPLFEPVSLAEAKAHLRVDHDAEDAPIRSMIAAARRAAERYTGLRWCSQTLEVAFPRPEAGGFWGPLRLPVAPVQTITAVRYVDPAGAIQALAADRYRADLSDSPPLLAPARGLGWPALDGCDLKPIRVECVAGWPTPADVPEDARLAILVLLAHFHANRGDGAGPGDDLPATARRLLDLVGPGGYS